MEIKLSNGSSHTLKEGSKAAELATELKLTGPDQALAVSVNGTVRDLSHTLSNGDTVSFLSFSDAEGQYVYWHTTAHLLAQAVLRLWPEAKPTIGPPIEKGFYYDFANLTLSDADFPKIETEMKKIIKENFRPERIEYPTKQEALKAFADNPYKLELIKEFPETDTFSAYQQGEFLDLCRGPHLPNLGKIKSFKIMRTSGAYWRGDSDREMLTRLYAISFPDRKLLKDHLHWLEEAKKRDHKIIGPKLGLFSLKEEAPGMPFFHPKGMLVWNALIAFWRKLQDAAGYQEIKTPTMMTRSLWEASGHWENYRENMFTSEIEGRDFAIKPMNCPGACLYYKSKSHSYRELPLRVAELGHVHRYEPSGSLSGLFRVRSFHQDDAHIYMKPDDIEDEIVKVLDFADQLYSAFGLKYHMELSTRPEKSIGTDESWDVATKGLQNALERSSRKYTLNPGDGAFYGPKIDFHIQDALNRTWQCGTIQLDMSLPERFDLEYTAADGTRQRPIMIHRAIFGSVERFFGIILEHFGGRLPLWLSPRQVRLLTVADRHADFAFTVAEELKESGFHVEVDDSGESVSKKVRQAQLDQVNYILTIGDKEVEDKNVSVRTRDNTVHGATDIATLKTALLKERKERSSISCLN